MWQIAMVRPDAPILPVKHRPDAQVVPVGAKAGLDLRQSPVLAYKVPWILRVTAPRDNAAQSIPGGGCGDPVLVDGDASLGKVQEAGGGRRDGRGRGGAPVEFPARFPEPAGAVPRVLAGPARRVGDHQTAPVLQGQIPDGGHRVRVLRPSPRRVGGHVKDPRPERLRTGFQPGAQDIRGAPVPQRLPVGAAEHAGVRDQREPGLRDGAAPAPPGP